MGTLSLASPWVQSNEGFTFSRHPPVFLIFSYQQDKMLLTPFLENFLLEEN